MLDSFHLSYHIMGRLHKQINQIDWEKNMNYYNKITNEIVINTIVFRNI